MDLAQEQLYRYNLYSLKGRVEHLSILPLKEFGSGIYSINLGGYKNPILIVGAGDDIDMAFYLVDFLMFLLPQLKSGENLPSVAFIPYITKDNTKDLMDLCREWNVSRLYQLSFGDNKITGYLSQENSGSCRLICQLLDGGFGCEFLETASLSHSCPLVDFSNNLQGVSIGISLTPTTDYKVLMDIFKLIMVL